MERAYDDAKYGRFSARPYIDMVIPTLLDPSMAPPGKHVISCFVQYAPYHLKDGVWDDHKREAFGDTVINTIAEYAPNIKDIILHRQVLTPLDIERDFGLTEGKWVVADINVGILYLFALSSLGVYGVIMGGWASNSKYPFLSALRSAAQMVSYEVSIGFVIVTVLLCAGSMNLTEIVRSQSTGLGTMLGLPGSFLDWYFLPLLPMFVIFFVSALAETNRPPFDLVEAESELVAGFMVEYSSTPYLLFMLGEYVAIVLMCAMTVILFLGGWLPIIDIAPLNWVPGIVWFLIKLCFVFFMFAMVKAIVPRYRYDQLMRLGWKVFLPISLFWVALTAGVLTAFGWAP
jgi:NADH-quinone oxidoreductase subunit H